MVKSVEKGANTFANKQLEFAVSKLAMSLDYIFGPNTSRKLDYSVLEFQVLASDWSIEVHLGEGHAECVVFIPP